MTMMIKFWGVRGSIACSSPDYVKFGGHTSCVSVQVADQFIILDAGTGMRDLGLELPVKKISQATLLLSHAHFDHVIGLPFFQPLWDPAFQLNIVTSNAHFAKGAQAFFEEHLFHPTVFPVRFSELQSKINLYSVEQLQDINLGQYIRVDSIDLQHPGGSTGYRLQSQNKTLCYITDHEHQNVQIQKKLHRFVCNADLMIYDATFTREEYDTHNGWGHSTWEEGIKLCHQANIKQLALFHHNHLHNDDFMHTIEQQAQAQWPHVFAARQGMQLII